MSAEEIRDLNITASGCGTSASARGFVLNATVVPPGMMRWLTVWAQGESQPSTANLNDRDGTIMNNMALVPTANGSISAFVKDQTHLILDAFGYFAP